MFPGLVLLFFGTRNRIVSPLMKRVTAGYSLYPQPESFPRAMQFNGLPGIGGTARIVSAVVSQQRTDQIAVAADQQEKQLFHVIDSIPNRVALLMDNTITSKLTRVLRTRR